MAAVGTLGDPANAPQRGKKRAATDANQNPPVAKRARTNTVHKPSGTKKKRVVQDPTALFLRNPDTAPNGVLTLGTGTAGAPARTFVMPARSAQTDAVLRAPLPGAHTLRSAAVGSIMIKEKPLIELLGSVHMPSAAGVGPGTSAQGVPLEETLLMMHREFNNRIETMLQVRLANNLPTGLDRATESVRLSSGVIGVGAVATAAELALTEAERTHRVPLLIGLPATTLAKTRETWRPHGQLINTHGFAHENLRRATPAVTAGHHEDRARLFAKFFANDATPIADKPGPLRPDDFAIFHKLRREHADRFKIRAEFLNAAAIAMPRAGDTELERAFIDAQRFPARGEAFGEPLCILEPMCSVVDMAKRRGVQIDGPPPAFRLHDELAAYERDGKLPAELHCNGLCVDCELKRLTLLSYAPQASLQQEDRTLNHFTVRCEKGTKSYDPALMIPNVIHGTRKTGIVGYVPRYSREMRQFRMERRPGDPSSAPKVRVLADVSPNF